MKNVVKNSSLLVLMALTFSSCEVVKGIFNAGVGVGVFLVVLVLALIIFAVVKMGGKK